MVYVALLRGINVGGKNTVPMARLAGLFIDLGFTDVKTYINSGNVIFRAVERNEAGLTRRIEKAIEDEFGLNVPIVLRSRDELEALVVAIPRSWTNDADMRCDVLLLWPAVDRPSIVEQIPHNPEIEDVVYYPGAVVWRIDRANVRRGQVIKIIGSGVYKQVTIRNVNTVRKLLELIRGL